MSTFPNSPRVQKGAIVGLDPANPLASVVVFQYNPDTMTRRLEARTSGGDSADRSEGWRRRSVIRAPFKSPNGSIVKSDYSVPSCECGGTS